jgi:hypothetical protein
MATGISPIVLRSLDFPTLFFPVMMTMPGAIVSQPESANPPVA